MKIRDSNSIECNWYGSTVIPIDETFLFFLFNFINPVQLPLHELYFDLTLIRAAHTKNPIIRFKTDYLWTYNKKANLLRQLLSACDEWLVPIQSIIHRDMVIHDY